MKKLAMLLLLSVGVAAPASGEILNYTVYFDIDDVIIDTLVIEGTPYYRIDFDEDVPMSYHLNNFVGDDSSGLPSLPCRNVRYIIPHGHRVTRISNISYCTGMILGIDTSQYVIPSQREQPTLDGHAFHPFQHLNRSIYNNLYSYPDDSMLVRLVDAGGTLENFTLATLQITPFKYAPALGFLSYIESVTFTMETEPVSDAAPAFTMVWPEYLEYPEETIKRSFVANKEMINRYADGMNIVPDGVSHPWIYELIVIPDSSYIEPADRLRLWRIDTHRPAIVITLPEIDRRYDNCDLPEKIRRVFREYYHNNGTKALLLVDRETIRYLCDYNANNVPPVFQQHIGNCVYLGEFTRSYEDWDLDGDGIFGEPDHDNPDLYSEGWVGILPVQSSEEFGDYVDKLIQYERYGPGGAMLYYTTCVDQMQTYRQHEFYSRYLPDHVVVDIYSGIEQPSGFDPHPYTPFGAWVEDYYIYNQPLFVNESSHGAPHHNTGFTANYNEQPKTYMSSVPGDDPYGNMNPGYIGNLANSGNLMTMWTISCDAAAYDAKEWFADVRCMGELYTAIPDGGCIVYNGHARWGWVLSSKYMTRSYWGHLFNSFPSGPEYPEDYIAGAAFRNTRLDYPNSRDENYTMVLMGDPAVAIFTEPPRGYTITGDEKVFIGEVRFDHIITAGDGNPAEGALIAIRQNEHYSLGYVDEYGGIAGADGNPIVWEVSSLEDIFLTVSSWMGSDHNYLAGQLRIMVIDNRSPGNSSSLGRENPGIPVAYGLSPNYPNPFNARTRIELALPEDCGNVRIEIFNIRGQMVARPVDSPMEAGYHSLIWDGTNSAGETVPSGIYFYRLKTNNFTETRKMTILK